MEDDREVMDCYEFIWQTETEGLELRDCFDFGKNHWYGGAITKDHIWPLSNSSIPVQEQKRSYHYRTVSRAR